MLLRRNFDEAMTKDFIIFDVETTGLSASGGDRIVEIAALKMREARIIGRFYSLVDPKREISSGAFRVNRIDARMLMGAPSSREVLPRFLDFVGGGNLVGHNIDFDLGFLSYELSLMGLSLNKETAFVDTLKLARRFLPHLGQHRLWVVAQALGIKVRQQHRAMADVELTCAVYCKLMQMTRQPSLDI